jgi:hypothetical protein
VTETEVRTTPLTLNGGKSEKEKRGRDKQASDARIDLAPSHPTAHVAAISIPEIPTKRSNGSVSQRHPSRKKDNRKRGREKLQVKSNWILRTS